MSTGRIKLWWRVPKQPDSFNIYHALAPFAVDALPEPAATGLAATAREYYHLDQVREVDHYYRIAAVKNGRLYPSRGIRVRGIPEKIFDYQPILTCHVPENSHDIALTWTVTDAPDSFSVYHSLTPFDLNNLPEPLLGGLTDLFYIHSGRDVSVDHYYVVAAIKASKAYLSEVVKVDKESLQYQVMIYSSPYINENTNIKNNALTSKRMISNVDVLSYDNNLKTPSFGGYLQACTLIDDNFDLEILFDNLNYLQNQEFLCFWIFLAETDSEIKDLEYYESTFSSNKIFEAVGVHFDTINNLNAQFSCTEHSQNYGFATIHGPTSLRIKRQGNLLVLDFDKQGSGSIIPLDNNKYLNLISKCASEIETVMSVADIHIRRILNGDEIPLIYKIMAVGSKNQSFIKNDCKNGYTGTSVDYFKTYDGGIVESTISYEDAEAKAAAQSNILMENDASNYELEGQLYANARGGCILSN